MQLKSKLKHILVELKGHAPFTFFGALAGILFVIVFRNVTHSQAKVMFTIFHPSHVILSALVTSSMFVIHREKKNIILIIIVGYLGAIGISTLSDSIIPYLGENILGVSVPTHAKLHQHVHDDHAHEGHDHAHEHSAEHEEHEGSKLHLGFIEDWYIVNPAALLGIIIAYFIPRTKFPHGGHVLISTWASASHVLMNLQQDLTLITMLGFFIVLFLAVWIPCCISDIVFPLLLVKSDVEVSAECMDHEHHSHEHTIIDPDE